ncbi:hypothetical protein L211DRAFT_749444, partial [Terfezia boudieri ATCC MYA-4762]
SGGGGESVYYPSAQDVLKVKEIIQEASNMPLELIDEIIDFAQYWACSFKRTLFRQVLQAKTGLTDYGEYGDCNLMVVSLRSMPLGYDPSCGYLNTDGEQSLYRTKVPKPVFPDSDLSFLEPDTASVLEQWAKHSTPRGKNPCRKIVFTINSMERRWGCSPEDHGTYNGNYTWFDVGLERFTALKCGVSEYRMQTEVQRAIYYASQGRDFYHWLPRPEGRAEWIASINNQTALLAQKKVHVITWSFDDNVNPDSSEGDELEQQGRGRESMTGNFVRSLKLGDVVTVWARARFRGWRTNVEQVKMDIYWAV